MNYSTPNPYAALAFNGNEHEMDLDIDSYDHKDPPRLYEVLHASIQPNNRPVEPLTLADKKWIHTLMQDEQQAAEKTLLGSLVQFKPPAEREFVQVKRKGRQGKHHYERACTRPK